MTDQFPDDDELIDLAGEAAFKRGQSYWRASRATLSEVSAAGFTGEAVGTQTYSLGLQHSNNDWLWHCSCPATDDGTFCKHLVAGTLTAREALAENQERVLKPTRDSKPDDLLTFLCAQPAERLAGWLRALAHEDRDVEKRLLLYRAAEQPGALKAALAKVLNTGGFLDYRRAMEYARRLQPAIKQLAAVLQRDPVECRTLCEYVLGRLFKIYAKSDDSSGAIGEVLGEVAALHRCACTAEPPGAALLKPLLRLMGEDDWSVMALPDYWDALKSAGQAGYAKDVLAKFEQLPPPANNGGHFDESFSVCRRTEELARCTGDFYLLQRVLRRDLSHEWQHFRVLESLREFGRAREALAWAELAVKQFPGDGRLRASLAECLLESGMDDEALEQAWKGFEQHATVNSWDVLERYSKDDWPTWRDRALNHAAARERGDATARLGLLLHDGDLPTAAELANTHVVAAYVVHELAQRLRRSDPSGAGALYLRLARQQAQQLNRPSDYAKLVAYLKDASLLLPAENWQPLLASVRQDHARKPKLMGQLAKAGL